MKRRDLFKVLLGVFVAPAAALAGAAPGKVIPVVYGESPRYVTITHYFDLRHPVAALSPEEIALAESAFKAMSAHWDEWGGPGPYVFTHLIEQLPAGAA